MGSVWKAVHLDLQADVALKFIRPDNYNVKTSVERFRREARVLAQLKSAHIVQVLDFGLDQGAPYLAMEFLHGEDLSVMLDREQTLSPARAYSIILEAARGLAASHASGVIHRDIKPSNLFVSEHMGRQVVKLIDFGIAKERRADSNETTQGLVLGSPAYMSPEQARGGALDEATDVWSLAAVAYRILSGRPPIEGDNPNDTVVRICTESPLPLSAHRSDLGSYFDELFAQCFARDKKRRVTSLEELTTRFAQAVIGFDPSCSDELHKLGALQVTGARHSDPQQIQARTGRVDETGSLLFSNQPAVGHGDLNDNETASVSVARSARELALVRPKAVPLGRWSMFVIVSLTATTLALYFGSLRGDEVERKLGSSPRTFSAEVSKKHVPAVVVAEAHAPRSPAAPQLDAASAEQVPHTLPAKPSFPKKNTLSPKKNGARVSQINHDQGKPEGPASERVEASDVARDPVFGLPVHGP